MPPKRRKTAQKADAAILMASATEAEEPDEEMEVLIEEVVEAPQDPRLKTITPRDGVDFWIFFDQQVERWKETFQGLVEGGGPRDIGHLEELCIAFKLDLIPLIRETTPKARTALHKQMLENPGTYFCSKTEKATMKSRHTKAARNELDKKARLELG